MPTSDNSPSDRVSRRRAVQALAASGAGIGLQALLPDFARAQPLERASRQSSPALSGGGAVRSLEIAETRVRFDGRAAIATTINGTVPGPLLRLRQGEDATIRVRNGLREDTSVHWHGLILPAAMDGVPGLSFAGIRPSEEFEYQIPVRQSGTYWYHSHSGLQEQLGHYGPLIIEPVEPYPYRFDREFVIMLSDWTFEDPYRVLRRLKRQPDYYNYQRRTVGDFFRDVAHDGFMPTMRDRMTWSAMRMNPTDLADVTGASYSYLLNGSAPVDNWTGIFRPGERVLLRVINASAASYFDVRIPGVPMTIVQASGQYVQPVETDEFRIAIAETFDVILQLPEDRAYSVFAEAMDRSGFAAGTLAPREGMRATTPARRSRSLLAMSDMGMAHGAMGGMSHGGMPGMMSGGMPGMSRKPAPTAAADAHAGHDAAAAVPAENAQVRAPGSLPPEGTHGRARHGSGNSMVPMSLRHRLDEPGTGLGNDGWRVLVYTDLRALQPHEPFAAPTREIELHLTGNMERFIWAIDGVPFADAKPIELTLGERLRLTLANDTMMNHPMHLHGMWMELESGHGASSPRVHTVNVKPSERISLLVTADAPGRWAFHCHVLYHMEVGMFREVRVTADANAHADHHGGADD